VAPVKLYIDDLMEQHTAALFEPYADQPATRGGTFYDPGAFAGLVCELDARRFQVLIHAIGDRGVHVALDAIQHAREVNGPRDARHQLVHVELLAPPDLARFKELGVVAGIQPRHCAGDVGGSSEWRAAVGAARWPLAWPFRSLAQAGAALAFSSDWNVAEMDPLTGIYTALTRQDLAGGDPFVPGQAIDLATAIRAYTAGGAYANFCEHHRGSLAPGKAADLIALSGNLFELPPEQVKDCHVDLTMIEGQVHHQLW
jgi:predicted amidohydrolase YtcJ